MVWKDVEGTTRSLLIHSCIVWSYGTDSPSASPSLPSPTSAQKKKQVHTHRRAVAVSRCNSMLPLLLPLLLLVLLLWHEPQRRAQVCATLPRGPARLIIAACLRMAMLYGSPPQAQEKSIKCNPRQGKGIPRTEFVEPLKRVVQSHLRSHLSREFH